MEQNQYPDIFVIMPENDDEESGWYFNDDNLNTHGPFNSFEETVEIYNKFMGVNNE